MCSYISPYWGLRDYGTAEWEGGDSDCSHKRESKKSEKTITGHKNFEEMNGVGDAIYKSVCNRCGAIRKDKQLGLEETPEEFVDNLVKMFREVKRVLRKDGTIWLNLGDSYFSQGTNMDRNWDNRQKNFSKGKPKINLNHNILKQKDLCGIPWRVAFALQSDGWYLRQDIIWHKPNPMPESVQDRCTKSHEYIFLLTKSAKYFYDSDAVREPCETKENRPAGIVREREFNYNSKRNMNPQAYLTNSKYGDIDNESKHRQGMHKDRGQSVVVERPNLPNQKEFVDFIRDKTNAKNLSEDS